MHEMHRQRVKKRFLNEGLDGFEPHNILELLLFYSTVQKDTNEIAHNLMNKFGTLSAVFDAPFEELIKIDGIKEHSATLIKLIPEISRKYMIDRETLSTILSDNDKIGKFLVNNYIGATNEIVKLVLLDNKRNLIDCVTLHEGSVNSASVSVRKIAEITFARGASMIALAHNHPRGTAIPSMDDINTTRSIERVLGYLDIKFLEHFVIAGDKYTPIMRDTVLKGYGRQ